jgi:hypothetical protein
MKIGIYPTLSRSISCELPQKSERKPMSYLDQALQPANTSMLGDLLAATQP